MAAGTDTATEGKPEGTGDMSAYYKQPVLCLVASVTSESYVDVLMEARDCSLQVLHGDQHVLDHMVLFVKSSDGLSLGELQQ